MFCFVLCVFVWFCFLFGFGLVLFGFVWFCVVLFSLGLVWFCLGFFVVLFCFVWFCFVCLFICCFVLLLKLQTTGFKFESEQNLNKSPEYSSTVFECHISNISAYLCIQSCAKGSRWPKSIKTHFLCLPFPLFY